LASPPRINTGINKPKNVVKKVLVFTTVLLYQISLISNANAGFYDWLSSNELTTPTLVPAITEEYSVSSFEKLFWSSTKQDEPEIIPEQPKYEVVRESVRHITAYNVGDPYQTDSTPCTGAYSKVNLCEEIEKGTNVCAANFVPLGTILRIGSGEESFECIVWDRMNSRYTSRVDIAMSLSEKVQAKQFGLKKLNVQILKEVQNDQISI